jgi:NADPH:quinone reductase
MASDEIRALIVTAHGGPEVLQTGQRPRPAPAAGEVVIDVAAAGVNFIEIYQREGVYPMPTPFVLGSECAGTVAAVGRGVSGLAVGDLVATADAKAAMSEAAVAEAAKVVRVPSGIAAETAAALMLQGMTAHYLVNSTYRVEEGDQVLVHAAAGGVGQLLLQLCAAKGAHIVAVVGTAAKVDIARDLGAHEVLRYDEIDDLAAAVRDVSRGGVNVVYDGVGKATFDASLASVRLRGMMVLYGAASGPVPPFDPQRLNSGGSLFLTRPTLGHYTSTREELEWRAGSILDSVVEGTLRVEIGGRYPLDQAAQAYRDLEGRGTTGKLIIVPREPAD